jgi:tetrahydromethanopterin S-methyltransferase subunit G
VADPTVSMGFKEIGNAIILGFIGFFMWLLKKSIFGRMDKLDEKIEQMQEDYQPKTACVVFQTGCQHVISTKIDAVEKVVKERHDNLEQKIDLVLERQTEVISRIDKHINGGK